METYTLGALENPKDLRDIQLTQVQAPVSLPDKYITDISFIPVLNQKAIGSCVGHAHAIVHIYNEFKENGKVPDLSPRYLYALSKKLDGYVGQGTFPRVTAKIQSDKGCATQTTVPNNSDLSHEDYINIVETEAIALDAKPYKTKGYAAPLIDPYSLKQAIIQNGVVTITLSVGNFNNPIKKGNLGWHRVVAYGYEGDKFYFRNSWGEGWGDGGNGYFDYIDQQVIDPLAFLDLPNEIIEEAKKGYRYFSKWEVEKYKLPPNFWQILDKMRGIADTPFIPTSGLRTTDENRRVGGARNSAHLRGLAVDLLCTNNEKRTKMLNGVLNCGVPVFLEIAKKHLHISIDTSINTMGETIVSDDD